MARINTYVTDTSVQALDKWVGTDFNGGITKNFTAKSVADWVNSANAVGIAGQMNFKFQTNLISGRAQGTVSFDIGGGDQTAFSSITTFKLSKYNSGNLLIANFLNVLKNKYVLFCQTNNVNNFGVYRITDIVQDVSETDFYDITLTLIAANGEMIENEYYSLIAWPYNATGTNDKHYTHNQNSASAIWTVTHDLDKHPSVSVVLSTGLQGFGAVTYIDNNNLTIAFSGPETGKAYMN